MVVHAQEGLDEFSVSGPTYVAEVTSSEIKEYTISPNSFGFHPSTLHDVIGDTPDANAAIIESIFSNQLHDAKLDIVLLNAAAGLLVADKVATLLEGVEMARDAISSGRTMALLHQLQKGIK